MSVHKFAEQFACGKSQIATIIKNKSQILELMNQTYWVKPYITAKYHASLNLLMSMKFFINVKYLLAVSQNIYFVHPQLCEKVKEIAKQGIHSFKWVAWQVEEEVECENEKNENQWRIRRC